MKILLVSATPFEIAPLSQHLNKIFNKVNETLYQKGTLQVEILVTGVGMTNTAYKLGKAFAQNKYDLAINAGIAGAFNRELKLGDVVNVVSEIFGDLGIEEADGRFTDLFENKLLSDNDMYQNGKIYNPDSAEFSFLPQANALTINKVHGFPSSIKAIQSKYKCDIESMEGAAFFLACREAEVKFLQIRAVSNYVEKRNRDNWDLSLSIGNLNQVLLGLVQVMQQA
ncbi:MAG: futalosine hydrolase [Saprospiraceae bacterium]|jgi:futalosine hydrolase